MYFMMQQRAAADQLILIISQKCSRVRELLILNSLLHFISKKNKVLGQISSWVCIT